MYNQSSSKTKNQDQNQESDFENECAICLEKWTTTGSHVATKLKCGHIFGYSCIRGWVSKALSCPTCNSFSCKDQLRRLYQTVTTNYDGPSVSVVTSTSTQSVRINLGSSTSRGNEAMVTRIKINMDHNSTNVVYESMSLRRQTARGRGPTDRSRSPPDARPVAIERLRENAGASSSQH